MGAETDHDIFMRNSAIALMDMRKKISSEMEAHLDPNITVPKNEKSKKDKWFFIKK